MHEILLIRGTDPIHVVDALAVAAELVQSLGEDTQVDIAVPAAYADYAALSSAVRRVIPVAAPETGSWEALSDGDGDGNDSPDTHAAVKLGGKLFSAAKKISALAGENIKTYWKLKEELRITEYDVVFDFDFSAFSVALNKAAKSKKVVGFNVQQVPQAIPGGDLTAHEVYLIRGEMSDSTRMRHLAARHFDYRTATEAEPLDWLLHPGSAPPDTPAPPYLLAGGMISPPFMQIIEQQALPVVRVESEHTWSASELTGMVQGAERVVGNGIASALAAAAGIANIFIGTAKLAPARAVCVETPVALSEILLAALPSADTPVADAAADAPSADTPVADAAADAPSTDAPAPAGTLPLKKD